MVPDEKPASTPNKYAQYHEVKRGDTLSKIAEEYYGDKMMYPKIFEANKDILKDPNKIKPGQKLRIP
jgi:nucleoid-associated protein YgaU